MPVKNIHARATISRTKYTVSRCFADARNAIRKHDVVQNRMGARAYSRTAVSSSFFQLLDLEKMFLFTLLENAFFL